MNDLLKWLTESEPWTAYRTRLDLLGETAGEVPVVRVKEALIRHPIIKDMLGSLDDWDKAPITNHKKAGLWLHKLSFLAEAGLTPEDDSRIKRHVDALVSHIDENGVIMSVLNIPKAFGGTGENMRTWTLCDGPKAMAALARMGLAGQMRVGTDYLCSRVADFGWTCICAPSLGRFKGPGKRTDPCPYGTLLMLKLIAEYDDLKDSAAAHAGVSALLDLWTSSYDKRPFLFRAGTDFRKLKAPFVWYDILHVADVLSQYGWLKGDARMAEILDVISAKADADGRYTAESVWMAYKGFDFAQKKTPSSWLTFLVLRILKRSGRS